MLTYLQYNLNTVIPNMFSIVHVDRTELYIELPLLTDQSAQNTYLLIVIIVRNK